jgi:hypothetical protein
MWLGFDAASSGGVEAEHMAVHAEERLRAPSSQ